MAASLAKPPPCSPLIAVIGSTGTGKSDLAIALAKRFNGEIINADAMQMYQGLPILTNKLPLTARESVPHHLLGEIGLEERPHNVVDFKAAALRIASDVRARGKLPILVGGTHYYLLGTLGEESILGVQEGGDLPQLREPPEDILRMLRKVDPVMAERWHPRDTRKIKRSLEIFLRTGRPASEVYAEQLERQSVPAGLEDSLLSKTLFFWVHAERTALVDRLNRRVDKMFADGLIDEVQELNKFLEAKDASGQPVDKSFGIWQTIGLKHFLPYVKGLHGSPQLDGNSLEALKKSGLEDTKTATRRYAKEQVRYIQRNLLRQLQREDPSVSSRTFVLDSSDVSRWSTQVVEPAIAVAEAFLEGGALPDPAGLSDAARRLLEQTDEAVDMRDAESFIQETCVSCGTTVAKRAWDAHLKSRRHKATLKRKKRRALVPHDESANAATRTANDEGPELSYAPDLGQLHG